MVTVADELDMIIDDLGVTATELADRLKKNKSQISRLLSGDHNMTLNTLSDVCSVLGIAPRIKFSDASGKTLNPDYNGNPEYETTTSRKLELVYKSDKDLSPPTRIKGRGKQDLLKHELTYGAPQECNIAN
jgi:transcriptional regulator with XRE-family HTH domain